MIQGFRFIEISKYDDGGQLMSAAKLCPEAVLPCDQLLPGTNYRQTEFKWI